MVGKLKYTVNTGGKQVYNYLHNIKMILYGLCFSHVNLLWPELFQGNIPTSALYLKIIALLSDEGKNKGACFRVPTSKIHLLRLL